MNIIKELESALGNGARPYKYRIEIKPANGADKGDNSLLNTLCKATSIPGVRLQPRNFFIKGHSVPVDGIKQYDTEWNCTFYLDGDYTTRLILEHWLAYIDGSMSGDFGDVVPLKNGNLMGVITSKLKSFVTSNIVNPSLDFLSGAGDSLASFGDDAVAGASNAYSWIMADVPNKPQIDLTTKPTATTSEPKYTGVSDAYGGFKDSVKKLAADLQNDEKLENISKQALYGSIYITPMDYSNTTPIVTYILHNAFPISLQAIQFDDTNTTSVSEFTASFAFSHYTIERTKSLEEKLAEGLDFFINV